VVALFYQLVKFGARGFWRSSNRSAAATPDISPGKSHAIRVYQAQFAAECAVNERGQWWNPMFIGRKDKSETTSGWALIGRSEDQETPKTNPPLPHNLTKDTQLHLIGLNRAVPPQFGRFAVIV
jgi:hypothetical protein